MKHDEEYLKELRKKASWLKTIDPVRWLNEIRGWIEDDLLSNPDIAEEYLRNRGYDIKELEKKGAELINEINKKYNGIHK